MSGEVASDICTGVRWLLWSLETYVAKTGWCSVTSIHGPKCICILLVLFWSGYQSSSLNVVIVSLAFRRVIYLYSGDSSQALRNGNETYLHWNCQPIIEWLCCHSRVHGKYVPAFPPLYLRILNLTEGIYQWPTLCILIINFRWDCRAGHHWRSHRATKPLGWCNIYSGKTMEIIAGEQMASHQSFLGTTTPQDNSVLYRKQQYVSV